MRAKCVIRSIISPFVARFCHLPTRQLPAMRELTETCTSVGFSARSSHSLMAAMYVEIGKVPSMMLLSPGLPGALYDPSICRPLDTFMTTSAIVVSMLLIQRSCGCLALRASNHAM